jgi:hypothetical protein
MQAPNLDYKKLNFPSTKKSSIFSKTYECLLIIFMNILCRLLPSELKVFFFWKTQFSSANRKMENAKICMEFILWGL